MMNDFIERPVNARALTKRKLVQGVGNNDAGYVVSTKVDGKLILCPYYISWTSILNRCYSPSYHKTHPSYKDCTVCDEWLTFSNYRKWMETQDWEGKQIDKDILVAGNKEYGPDKCVFVDAYLNMLLTHKDRANSNGLPTGVSYDTEKKKYTARCNDGVKYKFLGRYATPEQAEAVYRDFKSGVITRAALTQGNQRIRDALMSRIKTGIV